MWIRASLEYTMHANAVVVVVVVVVVVIIVDFVIIVVVLVFTPNILPLTRFL